MLTYEASRSGRQELARASERLPRVSDILVEVTREVSTDGAQDVDEEVPADTEPNYYSQGRRQPSTATTENGGISRLEQQHAAGAIVTHQSQTRT